MKTISVMTADEAAGLVKDGDTLVICGCENVLTPDALLGALGRRHDETGAPKRLTEIHPIIVGMGAGRGLENLARPGMVACAIGSGYSFLKESRYTSLLNANAFEAHCLPMGTVFQMLRGIAAKQEKTVTDVGLDTFVDPDLGGGRMNAAAKEPIVRKEMADGKARLVYDNPRIDIAFLRGTSADEFGNISLEDEPVSLGIRTMAMAAKNSGGKVIVQVRRLVKGGSLHPRMVEIPGIFVDAVVVAPEQSVSGGALNPALTGEVRIPYQGQSRVEPGPSRIIASRAAQEIRDGEVVNLGVGMPIEIPRILNERGESGGTTFFPEHGSIGGVPGDRAIFGTNVNPDAIIDSTNVFDFFLGGGLDITFLGFGQLDAQGNVNVSRFNGIVPGCGGFVDITHQTKRVVFCGSFNAGGVDIRWQDGRLVVASEGRFSKLIPAVEQVTFNAASARRKGQQVLYVTERAVFSLQENGLRLDEVAPGIDVKSQILDLVPFAIEVSPALKPMDARHFGDQ
ncbi:CoA-transferase [Rhodobacter sp. 24-YEA-8]|uniref:CoA-transferase n=1 Tax=Rhodobacter sp. 24-YEA-8 TaxID=1884310 RepID=UPI00089A99C4|nr:CoA-transferase [Rhodobacter sp. 24-YEA-8]SED50505.1 propionate CoA-transferase [Rhodobacter sp. 24-YEA-8]